MSRKLSIWLIWLTLCAGLAGLLGYEMLAKPEKPSFLIGPTTHGHYQIELSCDTCHTDPFGGKELLHDACMGCHEQELKDAHDSHPRKKFTDPRNVDRLEKINATNCVSCHGEHKQHQTFAMGVTLPEDFCYECHQEVAKDRPSHEGMGFDTCASAGCHNFHDNRALYEDFLLANQSGPMVKAMAQVLARSGTQDIKRKEPLSLAQADADAAHEIVEGWSLSGHAEAGVNCTDCHSTTGVWQDDPGVASCSSCHENEESGFLAGKHGMRLKAGLGKMSPALARLPFKADADQSGLDCASCHDAHQPDLKVAAVESCQSCHDDDHSRNYADSPHASLWQKELADELPAGSGVTCATCHMPREAHKAFGKVTVRVEHNQNMNLRPNEKMVRSVCMDCHSLAFSLDALADQTLIMNNFNGKPGSHIPSIDMAVARDREKKDR
ncbi:cytochrome c3 family protein [Neptuniibacter sp. CAU 1671]|uniref:cytochrome c3 family protein n=1 Tax=Neptuniibacter sp. CAU 1671 TaxID=3032593 RepID=UPI0023DB2ADC|nr:cytochrome c3 family protein [Neptuniibacter sp. CAU 1671]MDF2182471.1 cytochrome c3 family protein [Neptuniibacter sp. CAU 1671]